MTDKNKILILGYGEMGHAMEYLLQDSQKLDIWDKYPQDNFQSAVLEEVAPQADIVLFCLPVNPHREVAEQIAPLLKDSCLCLSIAKGLDEAGQTAAQIFSDVFKINQSVLLYGPMISEEIQAGRYSFAQLGSVDNESFQKIRSLYESTNLYIEHSSDIVGISWSVILKNVYAMIFGMADECLLGDNMRGYLAYAALQELDHIVHEMGGQKGSPYHLAGLGDLITTATSEDSHHHELGRMLARGETENIVGEGVHTLQMVAKYQLVDTQKYPLFQLIESIVKHPDNVETRIQAYLQKVYSHAKP